MAKLVIDLRDEESIAMGIAILQQQGVDISFTAEEGDGAVGDVDDLLIGGEDTDMDSLLNEPEPEPAITVESMKDAFRSLVAAKGKDAGVSLVKKALAKMSVDKMEAIPEEKREVFIKVLNAAAAK